MLRPFHGPPLKQLPQFGRKHKEDLLWGTYRPGYYFGELQFVAADAASCNNPAANDVAMLQLPMPAVPTTLQPLICTGLRTRQPQSLLVGMMWTDPQRQDPLGNIRYTQ